MAAQAPSFWWKPPNWRAGVLAPLASLYGAVARRRMLQAKREKIGLPVLCVGNFTVGGSGKTPVAIALAKHARLLNLNPGFLSRGHGGRASKPRIVDLRTDTAAQVGDEPLLLAEHAPVAVTPDRAAGARLLQEQGCDFLIMDDGFQSARIHIDYALMVVDARYGLGNGRVIPAGPLRAPLADQLRFADAILRMGEGGAADALVRLASRAGKPVFEAWTATRGTDAFSGRRYLAFAGIGHPEKFFDSVAQAGGDVLLTCSFRDHHVYSGKDLAKLETAARADDLELITTAKDAARLRATAPASFLARLKILEIDAVFELERAPSRIIEATLAAWKRRR